MKTSARPSRRRPAEVLPGVHGTARVERRVALLLPRLRPGDVAVLDVLDLDRPTAQALADARVAAVVDASELISGRYPNLGPEVLAEAGVTLLDGIGADGLAAIKDGTGVRVHEGSVYVGDEAVASGRVLDRASIETALGAARQGMISQLQSFTHNSSEFLRREQDLLLHGSRPADAAHRDGAVVRSSWSPTRASWRRGARTSSRSCASSGPVLVGVDAGADALLAAGHQPHVVVVTASADPPEREGRPRGPGRRPGRRARRRPVVRGDPRAARRPPAPAGDHGRGAGRRPAPGRRRRGPRHRRWSAPGPPWRSSWTAAATGLASTYLTRLKVGTRIVDAEAVPTLYSGRVRPRHVLLALLVCVIAVAAAIATTPVGQEWAQDAWTWLGDAFADLRETLS